MDRKSFTLNMVEALSLSHITIFDKVMRVERYIKVFNIAIYMQM